MRSGAPETSYITFWVPPSYSPFWLNVIDMVRRLTVSGLVDLIVGFSQRLVVFTFMPPEKGARQASEGSTWRTTDCPTEQCTEPTARERIFVVVVHTKPQWLVIIRVTRPG